MEELYPGVSRARLPGGLSVLFEPRPDRPLALGVWLRLGSRDDPAEQAGLAHFLEHMLFKGTARRSALQISQAIDGLGGDINAATSKEYTFFHVEVLPQHLETALDVLADLVRRPLLAPEEIEREKGVVLSEIQAAHDMPQERVFELFMEKLWRDDHPLGRPIAGEEETVRALSQTQLRQRFECLRPEALFLTAAGGVAPAELLRVAGEKLGDLEACPAEFHREPPRPNASGLYLEEKETQQVHLCLGLPALARGDERRWALEVLSTVLGGGMSSRLFTRIREQLGLAYAVSSGSSYFQDGGLLLIYLGTEPGKARQAAEVSREELQRLEREPISPEELRLAKQKMTGNMLLGLESSHARMMRLGGSEIYRQHLPLEQVIARLEAVSSEQVQALARQLLGEQPLTLAAVGPAAGLKTLEGLLDA